MKKTVYDELEMKIIIFDAEDVITDSSDIPSVSEDEIPFAPNKP